LLSTSQEELESNVVNDGITISILLLKKIVGLSKKNGYYIFIIKQTVIGGLKLQKISEEELIMP
jgi:hypothetical protein